MVWTIKDSHSPNSTEPLAAVESHHRLPSVRTEHRTDRAAQTHVLLSTFTDTALLDSNDEGTAENLGYLVENASLVKDTIVKRNRKPRGSYKRYNLDQIEKLFDLVIEAGKTSKEAALNTGLNVRTAQHYVKKCNDDEERRPPCRHRETKIGNSRKLTAALSPFLRLN